MNASKSIRRYCVDFCCYNQPNEVNLCPSKDCSLFPYRLGRKSEETKHTRIKAIAVRCHDCIGKMTSKCDDTECQLYPYRTGKNPNIKGRKGNPEALRKFWDRRIWLNNAKFNKNV